MERAIQPQSLYRYRPLLPENREFRLLHVRPSTDPPETSLRGFCCSLAHVSLDDKPSYVALSYTWGDNSPTETISIDGDLFYITKSLLVAIRHLHNFDPLLTIWADAICINQDNDGEKSSQVMQMQAIYEAASFVLVWLGPASTTSAQAMDFLQNIGQKTAEYLGIASSDERLSLSKLHSIALQKMVASSTWADVFNPVQRFFSDLIATVVGDITLLQAANLLFRRSWWERIWTLQEVAVARRVIYACGGKRVPGEILELALFAYLTATALTGMESQAQSSVDALGPSEIGNIEAVPAFLRFLSTLQARFSLRDPHDRSDLFTALFHMCNECSIFHRRCMFATNPRDQIYALLGLVSDSKQLNITVDYSKSCADVFTDAAMAILLQSKDLFLLSLSHGPKRQPNLPSWVPDWSVGITGTLNALNVFNSGTVGCKGYSASGDSVVKWGNLPRSKFGQLVLYGSSIDVVRDIATVQAPHEQLLMDDPISFLDLFSAWLKEVEKLSRSWLGENETISSGENPIWKTVLADYIHKSKFTKGQSEWMRTSNFPSQVLQQLYEVFRDGKYIDAHKNPATDGPLQLQHLNSYMTSVLTQNRRRRIFISKCGKVGLGPENIQPGDLIVILYGGALPFILREKSYTVANNATASPDQSKTSFRWSLSREGLQINAQARTGKRSDACRVSSNHVDGDERRFQLLGEAYVDGIMDGELAEQFSDELFVLE